MRHLPCKIGGKRAGYKQFVIGSPVVHYTDEGSCDLCAHIEHRLLACTRIEPAANPDAFRVCVADRFHDATACAAWTGIYSSVGKHPHASINVVGTNDNRVVDLHTHRL